MKTDNILDFERALAGLGARTKVVVLAQNYVRACSGLWSPPAELPEVLFDGTL